MTPLVPLPSPLYINTTSPYMKPYIYSFFPLEQLQIVKLNTSLGLLTTENKNYTRLELTL